MPDVLSEFILVFAKVASAVVKQVGGMDNPKGSAYPIIRYLGFWVIVIAVQVLGKYIGSP